MKFTQKGSLNMVLAVALGAVLVVAAVAAKFYLDAVRSEYREAPGFSHDELFRPVKEIDAKGKTNLDVTFKCSALAESAGYTRDLNVTVGSHLIAYDKGEMQAFFDETDNGTTIPSKMDLKFEIWRGTVESGRVNVEGWYTEGPSNTVKQLNFKGTYENGVLDLHGKRGPRYCSVTTPDVAQ